MATTTISFAGIQGSTVSEMEGKSVSQWLPMWFLLLVSYVAPHVE
jgi:hypothetical protein